MEPDDIEEFEIDRSEDPGRIEEMLEGQQEEEIMGFFIVPQPPDEPVDEFTDQFTYTVDYWKLENEETTRDNILNRIETLPLELGLSAVKNNVYPDFAHQATEQPVPMAKVIDIAPESYTTAEIDQNHGYAFKVEQITEGEIPQEFKDEKPESILDHVPLYNARHYQATDQVFQDHGFDPSIVGEKQSAAQKLMHEIETSWQSGKYDNKAYGQEKGFFK